MWPGPPETRATAASWPTPACSPLSSAVVDALASLAERLPDGAVSTHPGELSTRSRDAWALAMLREARGDRLPRPLAVVFPTSTEDVAAALSWATETGMAPGDFVRTCKQLLDLLRQIRDVAGDDQSDAAAAAHTAVNHGVVAYTGV